MESSISTSPAPRNDQKGPFNPSLILHGGAGSITRATLPPELYARYHASLLSYLTSTNDLLQSGANALDAACHAVSLMEDDELFNCSKGSVFTDAGECEMEASLMVSSVLLEGKARKEIIPGLTKKNAAVSLLRHTRHPIFLAREVLTMADEKAEEEDGVGAGEFHADPSADKRNMHGHLSGMDVEEWGFKQRGLERKGKKWFWTRKRWNEHRRGLGKSDSDREWKRKLGKVNDEFDDECEGESENGRDGADMNAIERSLLDDTEGGMCHDDAQEVRELPSQGTVGAVCMDSWGNLCTATSTGGLTNKRAGRIGDTPTVGAGFWAESWDEDEDEDVDEDEDKNSPQPNTTGSYSETHTEDMGSSHPGWLVSGIRSGVNQSMKFWIGDCVPGLFDHGEMAHGDYSAASPSSPLPSGDRDASSRLQRIRDRTIDREKFQGLVINQKGYQMRDKPEMIAYSPFSSLKNKHHANSSRPADSTSTLSTTQSVSNLRPKHLPNQKSGRKRIATALSGTGNGDSFLRTCATHTASSISRYSLSTSTSLSSSSPFLPQSALSAQPRKETKSPSRLQQSVTLVAGPNGHLQKSAGPRWDRKDGGGGEGEGGIIGIELVRRLNDDDHDGAEDGDKLLAATVAEEREQHPRKPNPRYESSVVFDFNCGGMWRAYYTDEGDHGGGKEMEPKVMVFREEYR